MKENIYEHNQKPPTRQRMYYSLGIWVSIYMFLIASGFYIIKANAPNKQIKPPVKNLSTSLTKPINDSLKINKAKSIDKAMIIVADDNGQQAIDEK